MKLRFKYLLLLAIFLFVSIPSSLFAHDGHSVANSFSYGLLHPFLGLDHLLAMVAIGLWAVQTGGKATWIIPISFLSMMILGGALGVMAISLPQVENIILVSVVVLGLLVTTASKAPLFVSAIIGGAFAIFHGHAHGSEMASGSSATLYSLGFALSTAFLLAIGVFTGSSLKKLNRTKSIQLAGATIALSGVCLLVI
jgi:urease accessory protein